MPDPRHDALADIIAEDEDEKEALRERIDALGEDLDEARARSAALEREIERRDTQDRKVGDALKQMFTAGVEFGWWLESRQREALTPEARAVLDAVLERWRITEQDAWTKS